MRRELQQDRESHSTFGVAHGPACWFRRRAETNFLSTSQLSSRSPPSKKFAIARTRSPACETHALPRIDSSHFHTDRQKMIDHVCTAIRVALDRLSSAA